MKLHSLKAFFLLAILMTWGCKSNSQQIKTPAKPIDETKVTWVKGIDQAIKQAQDEGKMLFVECYSPNCPYCMALEPNFSKPEVAKMYNTNFVNYKLNVEDPEEVKFLNSKGLWLPSFPMLLFFDNDGNLVHQSGTDPNVEALNNVAKTALDEKKNTTSYKSRFAAGERGISFLADYANYARVVKDTLTNIKVAEAMYEVYPKDKLGSEESWKLTKKAVADLDNGFATYWLAHVTEAGAMETKDGHPGNENNILGAVVQTTLYGQKGKNYNLKNLDNVEKAMNKIGAGQYAENVLWEFRLKANIRENHPQEALAIAQRMVTKFAQNGSAIVYIVRVLADNFKDNSYVPQAEKWMAQAIPTITQDNVKAEYHYEMARLSMKSGKVEDAKKYANEALTIATKLNTKDPKFANLKNSL